MTESTSLEPNPKPTRSHHRQQRLRQNLRAAEQALGHSLPPRLKSVLQAITQEWGFSLEEGELLILNGSCYVTHTGLLRLASRKRCCGMRVETVDLLCDSAAHRFVLKATVYPSKDSAGFVGYGDADPSNVSALVRGAELRMAETRAVNRALRKAYGIGLCSAEEMGSSTQCDAADNTSRVQQPFASGARGPMAPAARFATGCARLSVSTGSIPCW